MAKYIYEVVKEYVLYLDELDYVVKGRVSRLISDKKKDQYQWQISHHCKPSEGAAGAYFPSVITASTFDDAEKLLLNYMKSFTSIGVVKNEHY